MSVAVEVKPFDLNF